MKILIVLLLLGLCSSVYISFENQKCFDILGATAEDSLASIKTKYRHLALLYHPDRVHSNTQLKSGKRIEMQDINDAYECVTRAMAEAEESSLSQRGETVKTLGLEVWESIAETRRDEILLLMNEYLWSEDMVNDISYLVGKFFLNNEPDVLEGLIIVAVVGFVVNFILCTIGVVTLIYITYKVVKFVVKVTFWLVMYPLRLFYRLLLTPRQEKYD